MNNIIHRFDSLFHSIRLRLALWFVFILGLVLISFSGLVYLSRIRELQAESVTRLAARLEEIEKFLGEGDIPSFSSAPGSGQSFLRPEDILAIYGSDQIQQRLWGPLTSLPQLNFPNQISNSESRHVIRYASVIRENQQIDYAFLITPLLSGESLKGYVVIGTLFDPTEQRRSLLLTLIIFVSILLFVALAGGFWLADRAMRPVKVITQTAQQISETDLSRRFNLQKKDEIGQLADTFDAMLTRLESAFSRQKQFTADASHELRTPLTIVNLEAGRALSAPRTPKEYQRVLQIIQTENDLMSHLVNDLLTLARMDAGHESLQKEILDISDLALEVIERLEPLAARQNIVLETDDLPEVLILGDRKALTQMLTNLVENAIKYTTQNEVERDHRVTISTGCDLSLKFAWVRVTDTGPGISAEHITHLFDRFYRVDKSRSRTEGDTEESAPSGNGLGLAIVNSIAHLHGGKIKVTSEIGQGTTFEISFPVPVPGLA
ncbi:MAG: ATP-binding protein [Chloroflexi bacterium]|nr:ATP-binding protein [Chloroflexota bacterium]